MIISTKILLVLLLPTIQIKLHYFHYYFILHLLNTSNFQHIFQTNLMNNFFAYLFPFLQFINFINLFILVFVNQIFFESFYCQGLSWGYNFIVFCLCFLNLLLKNLMMHLRYSQYLFSITISDYKQSIVSCILFRRCCYYYIYFYNIYLQNIKFI